MRLPLTPAVHAVLPDQGESVGEHIEDCGKAAADRPHLEFVTFMGFTVIVEQVEPPYS